MQFGYSRCNIASLQEILLCSSKSKVVEEAFNRLVPFIVYVGEYTYSVIFDYDHYQELIKSLFTVLGALDASDPIVLVQSM